MSIYASAAHAVCLSRDFQAPSGKTGVIQYANSKVVDQSALIGKPDWFQSLKSKHILYLSLTLRCHVVFWKGEHFF